MPDGMPVKPAFQLLKERAEAHTPEWAETVTGIPAATIRRLAHEIGMTARDHTVELPIPWTDFWGREHPSVTGNPVAFHAMRGLAAHSNGFQTIRSLAILMTLLGTIDRPGGFRHRAPYPRAVPPNARPPKGPEAVKPDTPLDGAPLGWPERPDDLFVDAAGQPVRIDKGFSWEHPLSAHGLMHNVITNAWRGDPYPIDTLLLFMANMAWNSSMNTSAVRRMLVDKGADGEYRIPFIVVCDAFHSETLAFADLVLPDTSYLERHDAMSMLDRPISEFEGPVDAVRVPVVAPTGECRPFQDVLVELAGRLKFPAFTRPDGSRKYRDYADLVIHYETAPGSGIGFLAGWRGKDGEKSMRGEPNPRQWEMYAQNNCVFHYELPPRLQYMRNWNRDYLAWAQQAGLRRDNDPITIHLYSEILQSFRLAAQGRRPGKQPPDALRARVERFFDPLPFWYETLESQQSDHAAYPLNAVTQRPMAMYHSWDSQNAWLRQIHTYNFLFVNTRTALEQGIGDGDWMWVESRWGKVRCLCRAYRGRRAGHGVDLERDRQGLGRVEPGTRRQRVAAGIPAEPPDQRRAAVRRRRSTRVQFRPDHRAGRLVRREGAHPQGRGGRTGAELAPVRADADRARHGSAPADRRVAGRPRPGATEAAMTQLALVIDLNVCVGCHACVTSCKQWNTSGSAGPLVDERPYDADPTGTFFNRVQTFEVGEYPQTQTVHFPKSCLHCEDPPCVPVCPTQASYKRAEDGIVLVDYDKCIGCKYCAWACPYGVRELDESRKVMTKCTLCVDRVYDTALPAAERKPACVMACPTSARLFGDVHDADSEVSRAIRERGGYTLMPELGTLPANHYLPRRPMHASVDEAQLVRTETPLRIDGAPWPGTAAGATEDLAT